MPRPAFERWVLVGGFAAAAVYAVVAIVEVFANANPMVAIPYACTAVTIAAPLYIYARLLDPPRRDDPGEEGGPGPGPSGPEDPPPPSWWPEFERDFRAYTDAPASPPKRGERPRVPA
jgi:hypothetical protein